MPPFFFGGGARSTTGQRQREIQTDVQTDTDMDTGTEAETDKQRERWTEKDRKIYKHKGDRQTERQRQRGTVIDREMDRQTMSKQTFLYKLMCATDQLQVVNVHKLQQPRVNHYQPIIQLWSRVNHPATVTRRQSLSFHNSVNRDKFRQSHTSQAHHTAKHSFPACEN